MSSPENRARARAKAESAAHVAAANLSNRQSADHVDSSRKAIQRSLRLLGTRFYRGASED